MGIGGFCLVAAGVYCVRKKMTNQSIPSLTTEEKEQLLPPEITISKEEEPSYLPWWTGVKEISIYINKENSNEIEKEIQPLFDVV